MNRGAPQVLLAAALFWAAPTSLSQSLDPTVEAAGTRSFELPGNIGNQTTRSTDPGGWQPVFRDSIPAGADIVFEVPVTIESPPRALRVDGTGPLVSADQVIVTCSLHPHSATFVPGGPSLPGQLAEMQSILRSLVVSTTLPLDEFAASPSRVVRLAMDLPDDPPMPFTGLPYFCGMAIWAERLADQCPEGLCGLQSNQSRTAYEPQPRQPPAMVVSGELPEIP